MSPEIQKPLESGRKETGKGFFWAIIRPGNSPGDMGEQGLGAIVMVPRNYRQGERIEIRNGKSTRIDEKEIKIEITQPLIFLMDPLFTINKN